MAEIKIPLKDGLTVGNEVLKTAVLRNVIAGDVIEASEESEKLVYAVDANGRLMPTLVASPTMISAHVLRRQVVRLEGKGCKPYSGPLTLDELKSLSPEDLNKMQQMANDMDGAVAADEASDEVTQRGRSDAGGEAGG